jgi:hypothetical protein
MGKGAKPVMPKMTARHMLNTKDGIILPRPTISGIEQLGNYPATVTPEHFDRR